MHLSAAAGRLITTSTKPHGSRLARLYISYYGSQSHVGTDLHFTHVQLSIEVRIFIGRIIFSTNFMEGSKIECSCCENSPLADRLGSGVWVTVSFYNSCRVAGCGRRVAMLGVVLLLVFYCIINSKMRLVSLILYR